MEIGGVGWDDALLKMQVADELDEEMRLEADSQARNELDRLKSVLKIRINKDSNDLKSIFY